MSYITSIGTANPAYKFTQPQIANFMIKAMQLNEEEAKDLQILYRASGIETRHTVLKDYGQVNNFTFFSNGSNHNGSPTTKERLAIFRDQSVDLSLKAIKECTSRKKNFDLRDVTHLIVVSCTGMYAPGLDIDLTQQLGLKSTVQRTNINFMGCYAAFNAIKIADSFCAMDDTAIVMIVCVELCSLHFQKENTEDNRLANALFADGAAVLLIEAKPSEGLNLKINASFCDLLYDGVTDMTWSIGDHGFEMHLSSYVPAVIRNGIKKLTDSLLQKSGLLLSEISYFAIHPGGKKIIEAVEQEVGITKEQNRPAYAVLKKYGNMSSPTVLFVLKEILDTLTAADHHKKILSFGFGPGLTLESLVLQIENS